GRPDFRLPVLGLGHVANGLEQHRPVHLGEELSARAHATSLRAHRRGTLVDLVVAVRAGGETVWEGTSSYLAKGARPAGAAPEEPGATSPAEPEVTGDVVAVWSLGADTGRRYAEVSGDRNPIHVS